MATKTGTLSIVNNDSRLDDGTLLARCSEASPLSAATAFLRGLGFQSGDRIRVTGDDGTIGNVAVFCMTAAEPATQLARAVVGPPVKKPAPRKRSRKATAQPKKKVAKKSSAKKPMKKSGKKARRRS
jgi:hypothetical protein